MGREDDDIKVDNVICRTPARNAQNLDAVKNEILEMVDRAVSDIRVIVLINSNASFRTRSTPLRSSVLIDSTTVSSLPDFQRLTTLNRSTTARSTSPAPSRPATR